MKIKIVPISKGTSFIALPEGAKIHRVSSSESAAIYYLAAGNYEYRFGSNQSQISFNPPLLAELGDSLQIIISAANATVKILYE